MLRWRRPFLPFENMTFECESRRPNGSTRCTTSDAVSCGGAGDRTDEQIQLGRSTIRRHISFWERAMHATSQQIRNTTIFVLSAIFAALLADYWLGRIPFPAIVVLGLGFLLLGPVSVVLTLRLKEARLQKTFFLLAGASAAAIPICVVLHNLVYGLFIWWFGEGFWKRHGMPDGTPVFFNLAFGVFPALFILGAVGSIVLILRARRARQ